MKLNSQKLFLLAALVALFPMSLQAAEDEMVPLPLDLEIELALSALPVDLRADATVYVLDPAEGYRVHQAGSNGFTTLVGRSSIRFYQADWDYAYPTDQLIPLAFDSVGVEHHLKPYLDLAQMRAEGVAPAKAKETLRAKFADGTYTAPDKGGISYMLAPILRAYISPETSGDVMTSSSPHYMPYAPYATAKQLGNFSPMTGLPFALGHGVSDNAGPHGYMVILLLQERTAAIQTEYAGLLDELCTLHAGWCL